MFSTQDRQNRNSGSDQTSKFSLSNPQPDYFLGFPPNQSFKPCLYTYSHRNSWMNSSLTKFSLCRMNFVSPWLPPVGCSSLVPIRLSFLYALPQHMSSSSFNDSLQNLGPCHFFTLLISPLFPLYFFCIIFGEMRATAGKKKILAGKQRGEKNVISCVLKSNNSINKV